MAANKEEATTSSSQLISSNSLPYLYRGSSEHNDDSIQNKKLAQVTVDPDELIYNMDQSDERRLFFLRQGDCFVESKIDEKGIFWIKPLTSGIFDERTLSMRIENKIQTLNIKPYSKNKQKPSHNAKCFVFHKKSSGKDNNTYIYMRGLFERNSDTDKNFYVRLLDKGSLAYFDYNQVYPYVRLDTPLYKNEQSNIIEYCTPKYLAIRCCLTELKEGERLPNNLTERFRKLVYPGRVRFELVEQISIGDLQCWYAKIFMYNLDGTLNNSMCVNTALLENNEQQLDYLFKTNQLLRKTLNIDNRPMSSSLSINENKIDVGPYSSLPLNTNVPVPEGKNKTIDAMKSINASNETNSNASFSKNKSKSKKDKDRERRNKKKSNENTPEHTPKVNQQWVEDKKRTNSFNDNQVSSSSSHQRTNNMSNRNFSSSNTGSISHVSSINNNKNSERFQPNMIRQVNRQPDNFKSIQESIRRHVNLNPSAIPFVASNCNFLKYEF